MELTVADKIQLGYTYFVFEYLIWISWAPMLCWICVPIRLRKYLKATCLNSLSSADKCGGLVLGSVDGGMDTLGECFSKLNVQRCLLQVLDDHNAGVIFSLGRVDVLHVDVSDQFLCETFLDQPLEARHCFDCD